MLPERVGVAAIPLTAFTASEYREDYAGLVRFAECKRIEVLEETAARLAASSLACATQPSEIPPVG